MKILSVVFVDFQDLYLNFKVEMDKFNKFCQIADFFKEKYGKINRNVVL